MQKIISVIGSGPAGIFFSKFLNELDHANNYKNILLFEQKQKFCVPGKKGCNLCAGVLAKTLIDKLELNGFEIHNNENIIQKYINGYCLITKLGKVYFEKPDSKIVSVSRSAWNEKTLNISSGFDGFIFNKIKNIPKIQIIYAQIIKLDRHKDKFILTDNKGNTYKSDILVNAFGTNSNLYPEIKKIIPGFNPPKMLYSKQAELKCDDSFLKEKFQNKIHIFSAPKFHNIKFFAVTPKKGHITLTAVGSKINTPVSHDIFLKIINYLKTEKYIPGKQPLYVCSCDALMPVSPVKNYLSDNILFIGDCGGFSRYLKNGIESTLITAYYAACALTYYNSASIKILKKHFYSKCKKIHYDNFFGKILFSLNDFIINHPYLEAAQLKIITDEYKHKSVFTGKIINILWNIFSGEKPYKKIFFNSINPKFIFKAFYNSINFYFKKNIIQTKYYKKNFYITPKKTVLKRIGIIGAGPAGSAAAIKAKLLAEKLNQNIDVYLFETKKFGSNFNQCVGVLSPPILSILKNELNITLDKNLIQRQIKGYNLFVNNENLKLTDTHHFKTYAVRRVEFDKLLLDTAVSKGCKLVEARVNDIEINSKTAHIYSDAGDFSVDAIIGAFGLDDAMHSVFKQRIKNYSPPEIMETIITKVHPVKNKDFYFSLFDDFIQVFLLKHPNIEFGAITPKHDHFTINIAGKNLSSKDMRKFLNHNLVKKFLPDYNDLSFFKGKFPVSPAKNFFNNRFVLVGDAAGLIRPFKGKGINSAVITGSIAAEILLKNGYSENNLKFYYYAIENILQDLPYGKIIRILTKLGKNTGLLNKVIKYAKNDRILYDVIFNIVSANKSYSEIIDNFSLKQIMKKILISLIIK